MCIMRDRDSFKETYEGRDKAGIVAAKSLRRNDWENGVEEVNDGSSKLLIYLSILI